MLILLKNLSQLKDIWKDINNTKLEKIRKKHRERFTKQLWYINIVKNRNLTTQFASRTLNYR